MEFEEAIKWLKKGERIKRGNWKSAFLKIDNKKVMMCLGFKKPWSYQFRNHDIFATDWAISTSHMFVDDDKYNELNLKSLNFN